MEMESWEHEPSPAHCQRELASDATFTNVVFTWGPKWSGMTASWTRSRPPTLCGMKSHSRPFRWLRPEAREKHLALAKSALLPWKTSQPTVGHLVGRHMRVKSLPFNCDTSCDTWERDTGVAQAQQWKPIICSSALMKARLMEIASTGVFAIPAGPKTILNCC